MKAIQAADRGGYDALRLVDIPRPQPQAGQALVAGGGGGGTGTARSRRDDAAAGPGAPPEAGPAGHGTAPGEPGRTDAGGGFGGLVLPSGAYVVKGDQVRWAPAVDVTIVVVASLSLVRVLARTWTRRSRRHRRR
jgi:hypothetical protein